MTKPRIEEIIKEFGKRYYKSYPDGFRVDDRISHTAMEDWLEEALTEAHQTGIDEVETQTLQEIMDDLALLHKRKEIDDNGFCTVRDLLHSKALQDNK